MKKNRLFWIFSWAFCFVLLASSCNVSQMQNESMEHIDFPLTESPFPEDDNNLTQQTNLIKGVWISYLEFDRILRDNNESEYTCQIYKMLDFLKEKGYNSVIVQVRSHGDAYYPSRIFPWSFHASGTAGKACDFDPLKILLDYAKQQGIAVHAWVNPYRLMTDEGMSLISETYQIKKWYQNPNYMAKGENGYWYLNPGKEEVTELILDGITELLEQYPDLSGIQFDDYFYDRVKPQAFGQDNQQGRKNITNMVKKVYDCVKKSGSRYLFGISPAGNFTDHPVSDDSQLTNLALWCTQEGYLDYVAPQIYWEFNHPTAPFAEILKKWETFLSDAPVTMYVGLAAYKFSGTDILEEEMTAIEQCTIAKGYFLFRYDNIAS